MRALRGEGVMIGVAGALIVASLAAPAAAGPPRRVASLNLSADEVLVEILPPERLVAVTRWADEAGTSNIVGRVPPSVFRVQKADMERLVALSPDLVVVSEYTDADFLRLLERSGIRHHRMRGLASLAGVRAAIVDLAREVGAGERAAPLLARYDETLRDVGQRLAGAKGKRVLYWAGGMTAGGDTAIGALIECAGGVNVGSQMGVQGIAPPGAERAFVTDPEVVLVGTWPLAVESLKKDPLLSRMAAVREGRIVVMPNELLVALSQYTADACRYLAAALHPDRFPPAPR